MKKLFFVWVGLLLCTAAGAQEAVRKELYNSWPLRLTAYHFTASDEYQFTLHGRFSTEVDQDPKDGSFDTRVRLFSGDASETKQLFDDLAAFIDKNIANGQAAFRIGETFIHRERWRSGGLCLIILPQGNQIRMTDSVFQDIRTAFRLYCEEQGL